MLYRSTVAKLDTALEFSDVPDFDVVGGEGEFAMEATTDSFYHRYYDETRGETRGDEEIEIWRSDQGATFEKKYCCPSMDLVLRATRYFCEYGAPDPELVWESRSRGRLGRIGDLES
jgi:hypothetical protein